MKKELLQNKEWLYEQYITFSKTANEIAELCDTKPHNVYRYLRKYNIKRTERRIFDQPYDSYDYLYEEYINKHRNMNDIGRDWNVSGDIIKGSLLYNHIEIRPTRKRFTDEQEIQEIIKLYTVDHKSSREIAEKYGSCHHSINDLLREYGVQIREGWESHLLNSIENIPKEYNNRDYLYQKYWIENMSSVEIGNELGVNQHNIRRKLKQFGIPMKTLSQALKNKIAGEKHPNWKGGITQLDEKLRRYFHKMIAPIVWQRDKYQCQLCGKTHTALHAHHIINFSDVVNEICAENPSLHCTIPEEKMQLYNLIINDSRFLDYKNIISICRDCHVDIHRYEKTDYKKYEEMSQKLKNRISQIYGDTEV